MTDDVQPTICEWHDCTAAAERTLVIVFGDGERSSHRYCGPHFREAEYLLEVYWAAERA